MGVCMVRCGGRLGEVYVEGAGFGSGGWGFCLFSFGVGLSFTSSSFWVD